MNVRDAQNLRNKLFIIGGLIMLSGYRYSPLMIIGSIVMFSGLIPHFRYNKCPHCGRQLGRNEADYCQFCGGKIDE